MMNRSYKNLFLCLFVLLLPSCSFKRQITITDPVTIEADEACIASFDDFAFSTPDIDGPQQAVILPAEPWQVEAPLPEGAREGDYQIAALRSVAGSTEIWLQPYEPGGVYNKTHPLVYQYLIYDTQSKTWRTVPARIAETLVFVDQLFVMSDGSIWGRNVWDRSSNLAGNPALSHYNETKSRFEFDPATSKIPHGLLNSDHSSAPFPDWDLVRLDANDVFWLFAHRDAIYSYDPATQKVTRRASLEPFQTIKDVTTAPDGSMYFRVLDSKTEGVSVQEGQLHQYFPDTEEIKPLPLPTQPWPAANSILADHMGRLWLGVFGWREPDGEWKPLHPQMDAFIQLNKNLPLWPHYQPPSVFMASSDGRLWFRIPRSEEWKTLRSGIAWYDPSTNQGCWVTTEGFNISEDTHQTLWLTAGGYLYRATPTSSTMTGTASFLIKARLISPRSPVSSVIHTGL